MDYLVCEESNAELLQFFTWFCHYVERWSELSLQEKKPSPPWRHAEPIERRRTNFSVHTHRRAGSDRLDQILEILDRRNANGKTSHTQEDVQIKTSSNTRNSSTPRRTSGTQTSHLQIAREERLKKEATVVKNTTDYLGKITFARCSAPWRAGSMLCRTNLVEQRSNHFDKRSTRS